jgi:hypothetical protein
MNTKICTKCKQTKEETSFYIDKGKHKTICKECECQRSKIWRQNNPKLALLQHAKWIKNNPEKHRKIQRKYNNKWRKLNKEKVKNTVLKSTYNITLEEYNKLLYKQNNCCNICGINQNMLNKRLFVDHNHLTNEIRGLLCPKCNTGIGQFNDSIDLLNKAIDYLLKKS